MIIDDLFAAEKYYSLNPLFVKAFEYLQTIDLETTIEGRYELQGDDLFYMVTNNAGLSKEASVANFECHNKYIDIQVCIRGNETFGWKPRADCSRLKESGQKMDYVFFDEVPDLYFQLRKNQFVIFFPKDAHAPMIGEGKIKKLVVKVKIEVEKK